MTIKRITVGNFKNISETTLDLSNMIALVSTNNYGKSNLLESIQFGFDYISASAKGRNNMMHWSKGIPLSPSLAGNDYIFSIEFDDPTLGIYRYVKYGFRFSWFNDQETGAIITDETIEMRPSESVRYTAYLKRSEGLYRAAKSKMNFRKITLAKDILAIDVISSFDNIEISEVINRIKSLSYRMCNTLELDDSFRPNPIEFEIGNQFPMPFDDEDIPRTLSILKRDKPECFKLFVETIYDLFPEFKSIELNSYIIKEKQPLKAIVLSQNDNNTTDTQELPYRIKDEIYRLIINSKYLNQPISMEHMSTGTKRIFWLIANAIFGDYCNINILGVDEIETSIHPKMIRNLLESLSDILKSTSMIVTSHSPYLIQYLKPESIYVGVPNESGIASFKRIQHTKVRSLINVSHDLEVSIGEYLFELLSGDEDSAAILSAYLEDSDNV